MAMSKKSGIYAHIENAVAESDARIKRLQIGLTWTSCRTDGESGDQFGFAMSPGEKTRVLSWPGTLAGQQVRDVAGMLHSWNPFEVTVALAACNGVINHSGNSLLQRATPIAVDERANTAVFQYFKPRLTGKNVVIIGRYPHLDKVLEGVNYCVLERMPGEGDLPDTAAETLVPNADWVFVTSTSIINNTFGRLTDLAQNAVTVLMGPTTPWLSELVEYGVDFIAGTAVANGDFAEQVAMEGGGTRLFDGGVQYRVADISQARLAVLKQQIAHTAEQRNFLKREMDSWYASGQRGRFSGYAELETVDAQLSVLDTAYKRLWDATREEWNVD